MTMWMIWASAVTALLGAAALAAERAMRSIDRPGRWAWAAAIVFALGLQGWSWVAPTEHLPAGVERVSAFGAPSADPVVAPEGSLLAAASEWASTLDTPAGFAWAGATLLLLLSLTVGVVRLRIRMRRWPRARVAGEPVLLSPSFGPALVGVLKPWIVLPRWALGLDQERLRLAFLHEVEHRDARDTSLLLAASLALALNPWNPAMWLCVRRLRQSVELDCDRRVLARGVSPESYGTLLIDLSAASEPFRLPVAALSNRTSLLERRLKMMKGRKGMKRVSPVRLAGSITAVTALTFAACEAPTPAAPNAARDQAVVTSAGGASDALSGAEPMLLVDGIRIQGDRAGLLDGLDPGTIERIEVIKGEAALASYGPEGSDGVINIIMKSGGVVDGESVARFREQGTLGGVLRQRAPQEEAEAGTPEKGKIRLLGRTSTRGSTESATIYLDGELVESLEDMDKSTIDRVEVTRTDADPIVNVYTKGS